MEETRNFNRIQTVVLAGAFLLYIGLALSNILTKSPEIDEGFFANPAFNLITQQKLATTVLETGGSGLRGIDQRTYWIMPLQPLAQAAWYKIFGFSLFSMRALSTAFGLLALVSWFFIMRRLSGSKGVALITVLFLSVDYTFVINAALGRMDMMCAALGFCGYSSYLALRTRDLRWAVLISQSFIVASGLTHPNGILYFAGLLFISLYLDRKNFKIIHVMLAILPYVFGGLAWGLYVLEAPHDFLAQLAANSSDGGRLSGLKAPWMGILREFTERYPHAFGLTVHSAGHAGPIYLKALLLIPYACAILLSLLVREIRNDIGNRILLIVFAIHGIILSLIDGQKETPYLIHLIPFYVAMLGVCLNFVWQRRLVPRQLLLVSAILLICLNVGGLLLRARQDTYGNLYEPTIAFLKSHSNAETTIVGPSSLGFGLGFSNQLRDDIRFGYYSGKRPDFIVVNEEYARSLEESRERNPVLLAYVQELLTTRYVGVYENQGFTVYRRLDLANQ